MLRSLWSFVTPPAPSAGASHQQIELYRRSKIAALIGIVIIVFVLPAFSSPTLNTIMTIGGVIAVDTFAILYFNRKGKLMTAGFLILLASHAGLIYTQFNYRDVFGGIDPGYFFQPSLLVQSELIAASLLPAAWVFVVSGTNCLFWVAFVLWSPHTPALNALVAKLGWGYIIAPPITIYLIVCIILYIWVNSANQAIVRADQADSTTRLVQEVAKVEASNFRQLQSVLLAVEAGLASIEANPRKPIIPQESYTEPQKAVLRFLNNYRIRLTAGQRELEQAKAQLSAITQAADGLTSLLAKTSSNDQLLFLLQQTRTRTLLDQLAFQIRLRLQATQQTCGESMQIPKPHDPQLNERER